MRYVIASLVVAATFTTSAPARPPALTTLIAEAQVALWRCQDQRAVTRTQYSVSPWALPRSKAYRRWVLSKWNTRLRDCRTALHAHDAVIRRLNRGLAGSPMAGLGATLERVGRKHGISPYFMAATAATESSLGARACANNRMNVWGLANCDGRWYVPRWGSWEDAITFYARFLTSRWPSATTTYSYRGYAACSDCWGRKTASHMAHLFGVGNGVRY